MSLAVTAWKGHGTENDFIVLPDLDAVLSLSPSLVRALCDRRAGIGADGVLRVMRTERVTEPDVQAQAGVAEFFMDYHNADGSIAEMCGNGARVFARYLQRTGLVTDSTVIATRGGPRAVSFLGEEVAVVMGAPAMRAEPPVVTCDTVDQVRAVDAVHAIAVDLPNPHVVVELASTEQLEALDLTGAPKVQPALPDGQNVEFFVRTGPGQLRMRVHERGVGETRSCGTGICAVVAVAAAQVAGVDRWQVEVPGGRCEVSWTPDGQLVLRGPAVLVATVSITPDWLASHR